MATNHPTGHRAEDGFVHHHAVTNHLREDGGSETSASHAGTGQSMEGRGIFVIYLYS